MVPTPNYGFAVPNRGQKVKDTIDALGVTVGSIDTILKEHADGLGSIETDISALFQSGNDGKNLLEAAIVAKNGTVSKAGAVATFAELNAGIGSITGGGLTIDAVRLNVTAGYTKNWVLGSGKTPLDLMITLVEHLPAQQSNPLNMGFNNGDAGDFESNPYLVFDGQMKLKTVWPLSMSVASGSVYISNAIAINQFEYSGPISYSGPQSVSLPLTPKPQVATPKNFVNIAGITQIDSVAITTVGTGGVIKYAVDFGSGAKKWNGSAWVACVDVNASGNTEEEIEGLTSAQWELGRSGSGQFKMIYGLDATQRDCTVGSNSVILTVTHPSKPAFAATTDYSISQVGQTVTLTISKNGDYTIRSV